MTALATLREDLERVGFVPGTEGVAPFEARLRHARRLLEVKIRLEASRGPAAPPFVVIAGGTNVGKSTVFNWLAGETVSKSSPLARTTKAPAVFVHASERAALEDGAFLPDLKKVALRDPEDLANPESRSVFLRSHEREDARGVVLIDSPDIDSTYAQNRELAFDLLYLADAVVFVATPEKYNDEICVDYLREAAGYEKRIVCVLNKGAGEDVARDFDRVVGPAIGPRRAIVVHVPYLPAPTPELDGPWKTELRKAAAAGSRNDAARVRAESLEGARRRFAEDVALVLGRLREEVAELDRTRAEAEGAIDQSAQRYRGFLFELDFYELDRVFERVLEHFRIPVLDDVYGAMRGAARAVTSTVARTLTGRQEQDARVLKMQARRERERQKTKELFEVARSDVANVPERVAGPLRKVAGSWVPAPPSPESVNQAIEGFLGRAEEEAERWIADETARHVELVKKHPRTKAALRAFKGLFQIGFGLASAYLTGGLLHSVWDSLVIGAATERAAKMLLESMGGFVHYQTLKSDYTKTRAALFRTLLERQVLAPLVERLPPAPDPVRLARIERAAEELARGAPLE